MKKIKNSLLTILVTGSLVIMGGCEDAEEATKKVTKEVEEKIQAEVTKDNEYLLSVKGGSLHQYPDIKIEDAFANFFSSPTWKYFQADTGEHVVEFTGYCTYMEKKVKAKLQFLVEEGSETFETGALEFNEVPQNELTKVALIKAIYEDSSSNGNNDATDNKETTSEPDPNLAGNDSYFIEKAMDGYMVELDADTIGNIFTEPLFAEITWSVNEDGEVIINGNYSGEIYPGEGSNLEFILTEVDAGSFTISTLKFNGNEVPKENYYIILDIIEFAISQ